MGTEQPQQPRGSQAGPPPQAPGSARHWTLCPWGRGLILLVEKLHFVAQTSEKLIHSALFSVWEFL